MKPFDQNKPYRRRDGKPAKIVYENSLRYLVVAGTNAGKETSYWCNKDGCWTEGEKNNADLINIPEKIEGWGRVYKTLEGDGYIVYISSNAASKETCRNIADIDTCVSIIPVAFTEGEGLDDNQP